MATTRAMSSEDFRAQLYHSLQGRGILDSLKSQLRNRLVTELKKSMDGSGISSTSSETVRKSLHVQITDSIVAEYLKCAGYEYSLSIFLPEAGASMDNLCSEDDLFRYLRISPASDLYHHLKPHPQKPGDFLERLLEALIECQGSGVPQPPTIPSATPQQVPPHTPPAKKSVADRLEELDISYARRAEEESMKCRSSVEDRLSAFQLDLEAKYKRQLETELGLYRSKELARARQEERDRYREELAKEKSDLHRAHQLKLEDVKKSEQRMMEKYRQKEQELEAGIYSQRQTLLGELNSLRAKEAGIKRESELDKRTVAVEKEQMKALTEQLESNMKIVKTRFEKMAEEKVQKAKVELELQLQSKSAELAKLETRLKLNAESTESLRLKNEELLAELSEQQKLLQAQAQENESRAIVALQQSEETLGQFSDHRKVTELRQQLSCSESKCSELKSIQKHQQSTIKQLQAKLSRPSLEVVSLQAEVERLRKAHHKEMLVLEYDNKQLGRQLAAQTEQMVNSQKRLDEQLVQLRSAQREVQDLHSMLEHTQPRGGHGSWRIPAKHSKSIPSSSKKTSQSTRVSSAQHQTQYSKISTPPPIPYHTTPLFGEDLTSTQSFDHQRNEKSVSFFDSSGMFLAESRATIERMEKEARQLERNYFDFNYQTLSNSHDVSGFVPQSLLPGPSPLPDSFPSPFEPSSIGTAATPTSLVRTSHTFHSPLPHRPASGMDETQPRTDFLISPESYGRSPAPPVIPIPPPVISIPPLTSNSTPTPDPVNSIPPGLVTSVPPPTSDPVNSVPPPTSDPVNPVNSVPPPIPDPVNSVPLPVISESMLPQAFDQALSLPPDAAPKTDTSTAAAVLPTSSSLTHLPRHATPATSHSTKFPPSVAEANSLAATAAVSSLPGLSFTPRPPVPATVRTALSTELSSAGNTTVFPKSTMSLDSWWKAASEPSSGENVNFSSTKIPTAGSRVGSGDGLTVRTISSPELTLSTPTAISSSPAVTRLTGATQTVATSIAIRTSKELSGSIVRNDFETPTTTLTTSEEQPGDTPRNGPGEGHMLEPTIDRSQQLTTLSPPPPQRTVVKLKRDDSDEDGVDPVMLKYMQLVTKKRQDEDTRHLQARSGDRSESHSALSHDASSFDGFSNHEDAFEDW